jgi:hypothetical protein
MSYLDPHPPAIVTLAIGERGFLYTAIFDCPLCGEDHWHSRAMRDAQPLPFGPRAPHCHAHGPWGRRLVQRKGGDYEIVSRPVRPARHPTQLLSDREYCLVHDGGPVFFLGRQTGKAKLTALRLQRQGFEISEGPAPDWLTALYRSIWARRAR